MCCQYSTKIICKDHQHFGIVLTSMEFYGSWGVFFVCHSLLWHFSWGSKDRIHVSSIAMIHCIISSPSSPYLFRSSQAMFTRWCFSLSNSMWGTHQAAIFLICRRSVKIRWTDPWLMCNSWAISSHEYLLSSFSSFATFSTFSPAVADKGFPHKCLLLTISPVVELSYLSDDRTIWKYKLWAYFLECFLNLYQAFTPPSLNLNICYLFVARQRERTVCHDNFVNDVIFTWRHVKLFFPAQFLHETLMNNRAKFCYLT